MSSGLQTHLHKPLQTVQYCISGIACFDVPLLVTRSLGPRHQIQGCLPSVGEYIIFENLEVLTMLEAVGRGVCRGL